MEAMGSRRGKLVPDRAGEDRLREERVGDGHGDRVSERAPIPDDGGLVGLLDQTRHALAYLRVDQLEALAARAERVFAAGANPGNPTLNPGRPILDGDLRTVAAGHRVLGELLEATARNIAVLRRLRGEEVNARWGR
jgi:hypothetical protein